MLLTFFKEVFKEKLYTLVLKICTIWGVFGNENITGTGTKSVLSRGSF